MGATVPSKQDLQQRSPWVWEVPATFRADMRVPARLYADEDILAQALSDRSLEQLVNTATLPGIVGQAMAMPDVHQGYGFPIGGVVATRVSDGASGNALWNTALERGALAVAGQLVGLAARFAGRYPACGC